MRLQLTKAERELIALALHSLAMRQGPQYFDIIWQTAVKIRVDRELRDLSEQWIAFSQSKQ